MQAVKEKSRFRRYIEKVFSSYIALWSQLVAYYRAYGGLSDLLKSVYFHVSLLLTFLNRNDWKPVGAAAASSASDAWFTTVIGVMPDMLGFTLGGYAILLSFGDERYRDVISGTKKDPSPYVTVSATFLHFVVIQVMTLTTALIAKSLFRVSLCSYLAWPMSAFGYWLFMYSICLSAASAFAIFQLSGSFDRVKREQKQHERRKAMMNKDLEEARDSEQN